MSSAITVTLMIVFILFVLCLFLEIKKEKRISKGTFEEKINHIRVGATKTSVVNFLGMPNKIFTYSNGDYEYIYTKTYGRLGEFSKTARIFFSNRTEEVLRVDKNF